jgi:hypothetical protein
MVYKFRNVKMNYIVYPFIDNVPDFANPVGEFKTEYEAQKWIAINGGDYPEDRYLILPLATYIKKAS